MAWGKGPHSERPKDTDVVNMKSILKEPVERIQNIQKDTKSLKNLDMESFTIPPFQGKDQSSHCGMAAANSSRDRVPSPLVSNLAHSCQQITPTLS